MEQMQSNIDVKDEKFLERKLKCFGIEFSILQDLSGELGGSVWDSSLILIHYFENTDDFPLNFFRGKRILELGAGTGIISIVLSKLSPSKIIVTDMEKMLPLINENLKKNNCSDNIVEAKQLLWGNKEQLNAMKPPFDILIVCDCVANCYAEDYDNLINTMFDACDRQTLALLAYELRDKRDAIFFQKLRVKFDVVKLPNSKLHHKYQSEDIGIFQLKKKESIIN